MPRPQLGNTKQWPEVPPCCPSGQGEPQGGGGGGNRHQKTTILNQRHKPANAHLSSNFHSPVCLSILKGTLLLMNDDTHPLFRPTTQSRSICSDALSEMHAPHLYSEASGNNVGQEMRDRQREKSTTLTNGFPLSNRLISRRQGLRVHCNASRHKAAKRETPKLQAGSGSKAPRGFVKPI